MNPIEAKVIAATAGSGLGAALSAFLLWLLGVLVFGASSNADQVAKAVAAVPEPVGALLSILIAIGGAGLAGYFAPHTVVPVPVAVVPYTGPSAPMSVTPPAQPATILEPPAADPPQVPALVVVGDVVPVVAGPPTVLSSNTIPPV